MPTQVGVHAFASIGTARRGWCAFAHHDDVAEVGPQACYFNAYAGVSRHPRFNGRCADGRDTPGHDGERMTVSA